MIMGKNGICNTNSQNGTERTDPFGYYIFVKNSWTGAFHSITSIITLQGIGLPLTLRDSSNNPIIILLSWIAKYWNLRRVCDKEKQQATEVNQF